MYSRLAMSYTLAGICPDTLISVPAIDAGIRSATKEVSGMKTVF